MKKYIRIHLMALLGLTLLLVYQNCSSGGGQDLGSQDASSFGGSGSVSGYCQFTVGAFTSSPVTVHNSTTLPVGIITVIVTDPTGSYTTQTINSTTTSFLYAYTLTGNYLVNGYWQNSSGTQKPCTGTSFKTGTTNVVAPTCTLAFSGVPTVGQTGAYSISVSPTAEPIYFDGTLLTTGTAATVNHTFTTSDQPSVSNEAHILYNGTTIPCGNSPLSQNVASSGTPPPTYPPPTYPSSGTGSSCSSHTYGQCYLPTSPVSTTAVTGTCNDAGGCAFTCTSSGWVQVRNNCHTNNN